eukprot:4567140-Pyramimonas_sp.AAC.1
MGWTGSPIGQTALHVGKHSLADGMHPCRWKDSTALERCASFFRESQKITANVGEFKGMSARGALRTKFEKEVAASKMHPSSFDAIITIAYDCNRVLRHKRPA